MVGGGGEFAMHTLKFVTVCFKNYILHKQLFLLKLLILKQKAALLADTELNE